MLLLGTSTAFADPTNDEYGAQVFSINSLILETNTAEPGNKVEIIVDANNRMPDLKEIQGEFISPEGDIIEVDFYRVYFEDIEPMLKSGLNYPLDSAVFAAKEGTHQYYGATLKIPRHGEAGEYQLTTLSMQDYNNKRLKYVIEDTEAINSIRSKVLPENITVSVDSDYVLKLIECSTAIKPEGSKTDVTILVKATPETKRLSLKFRSLYTNRSYMLRLDESDYNYASKSFVSTLKLPETELGSILKLESATLRGDDVLSQKYVEDDGSSNSNDLKLGLDFKFSI